MVIAVLGSGCHNEPQLQYKERYDRFFSLLQSGEKTLFTGFEFPAAAAAFSARLQAGTADKTAFTALAAEENVELFSITNIFHYFGGAVYAKILYYRFIGFVTADELEAFNGYRLVEVARSLQQRLTGDAGLRRRFLALFPLERGYDTLGNAALVLRHYLAGSGKLTTHPEKDAAAAFIGLRQDVRDGIIALLAGRDVTAQGEAWEMRETARTLLATGADRLAGFRGPAAASVFRYRLHALVVLMRDVLDEQIDYFTRGARLRLQSLL
jgi:hypothetical protein